MHIPIKDKVLWFSHNLLFQCIFHPDYVPPESNHYWTMYIWPYIIHIYIISHLQGQALAEVLYLTGSIGIFDVICSQKGSHKYKVVVLPEYTLVLFGFITIEQRPKNKELGQKSKYVGRNLTLISKTYSYCYLQLHQQTIKAILPNL